MNETGNRTRLNSLKKTLAKWRRRSRTERILLLEAFVFLGVARLGVLILPFRRLAGSLGGHMKVADANVSPADLRRARMVGGAVRSAANYTPWESVCLPQAVAARWMLKRRRIPATLYLGVAKDLTDPGTLAAHAWVSCGPVILTGAKGHSQYTVVSTFS